MIASDSLKWGTSLDGPPEEKKHHAAFLTRANLLWLAWERPQLTEPRLRQFPSVVCSGNGCKALIW